MPAWKKTFQDVIGQEQHCMRVVRPDARFCYACQPMQDSAEQSVTPYMHILSVRNVEVRAKIPDE